MGQRGTAARVASQLAGAVSALIVLFPVCWMVLSSVKPFQELFAVPPTFWPRAATIEHYRQLLEVTSFPLYFRNSLIVAAGTTALSLALACLAAYGLTRYRFPGRDAFLTVVLLTYMFPPILLGIPLFVLMTGLKLTNSYLGLVLAHTTFALPFCVWLLRSFFRAVPIDIEEAAWIDGAGVARAFVRVVLPLAYPGIIAAGVFVFVLSWNDYLFALIFMVSEAKKTLPVGVSLFVQGASVEWGLIMAGAVLITLPVAVLMTFVQRFLIQGFGAGAVKG